jgi:hypothetical protein
VEPPPPSPADSGRRFQFQIDPKSPLELLLPEPPKVRKPSGPALASDLSQVPEVVFQAPLPSSVNAEEEAKRMALQMARINHLNDKETDGFVKALVGKRADLSGLPFAMGDACRTKGERSRRFTTAAAQVRQAMQERANADANGLRIGSVDDTRAASEAFWDQYRAICDQEDKTLVRVNKEVCDHVTAARVAALMQILAPEAPSLHIGLIKHLAGVPHVEATRALARLALFLPQDEVRKMAVDALKVRRERDYGDVLLGGLRYPLPSVAKRAAEALVTLERSDLVPQLVAALEAPDPRAPVVKEIDKKETPVVREVVKVNHHRSCLMCHSPVNEKVSGEALTATVPLPHEPLQPPTQGYAKAPTPDLQVRIDVTYLRQDFSAYQTVADAAPWPEMQRFDFLVRERTLTAEEADAYRKKLEDREPGQLSPYQKATVSALRELTGKDTEPSADAWRKLLKLPKS